MPKFLRVLCIVASLVVAGAGFAVSHRLSDPEWLGLLAISWVLLLVGTRIPLPSDTPTVNRAVVRTAIVLATAFAAIAAQLLRVQIVQRGATYNKIETTADGFTYSNPRKTGTSLTERRGRIFDRNGDLIADSQQDGDIYRRVYPNPVTGYVAGYYSPLLYGASGLEETYSDQLTGKTDRDAVDRTIDGLLHRDLVGLDLHLTLDTGLQQTATDLLAGRKGAVVVMEIATGAIVVLASIPSFDPNKLFTSSSAEAIVSAANDYWTSLNQDADDPFVLRPNLGLYTPGSTFKTVTASAAIDTGIDKPDDLFQDNGSLDIDGRTLIEENRPDPTRSEWSLEEGIAWSLNVVFAQVGLKIGADRLWDYGKRFGFGETIPFDLPVNQSQIADDRGFLDSQNALADTAFGQGEILVTPLHMCMVAATLANGGKMMTPYLVASVKDADGNPKEAHKAAVWKTPVSGATADTMKAMMINAVENGAITAAITPGYTVGGKTGTAETGTGGIHSWLIAFIGDPEPRFAGAVVLEEGSNSQGTSVMACQAILQATIEAANGQ